MKKTIAALTLMAIGAAACAATKDSTQAIIDHFYAQHSETEHFSALQVSIRAGNTMRHYVQGKVSLEDKAEALRADHLFNIGSISKSYTAVLALKAEARKQLSMNATLGDYLNDYPHWSALNLTALLNMTSGLPNYSDSASMNIAFVKTPTRVWSAREMLGLVYTPQHNPPLREGYHYTNTGYVLMEMLLEQQTKSGFSSLLKQEIFQALDLNNSFYPIPKPQTAVQKRLVSGYGYNVYTNPELVGRDMKNNNLSWGGAAGGIVANSEDVTRWVIALFENDKLLTPQQRHQMQQLVSTQNGQPIEKTSSEDPRGFALGLVQSYDPKIGRFWFYEGQTLGFRALYMYVPCNKVIITTLVNSATNGENDHVSRLMVALYNHTLQQHPALPGCGRLVQ